MLMLLFKLVALAVSVSARRATRKASAVELIAGKAQDELRAAETEVETSGKANVARAIMVASRLPALKADADRLMGEWDKRSAKADRLTAKAEKLAAAKGRWIPYLVGKLEAVAVCLAVVWLPTVVDLANLAESAMKAIGYGSAELADAAGE